MMHERTPDFELAASREEIARLRRELEETNRGLIALYAELEDAREAEARLAAMVQSSDDAMYSITAERVIDTWNPGAGRLLGHAAEEVIGRPVETLVPGEFQPELHAALERLGAGERAVSFDSWRRRKDGSQIEVAVTVSAMRDSVGRLIGYAVVLRDLTDRRRAEAELTAARAAQEVLATRDRIARDLHDGAIQAIFAVGMRLQATATMSQDAIVRHRLDEMVRRLDAVIADLRRHVFGVSPGGAGNLAEALRAAADEIAGRRGMQVRLDVDATAASRLEDRREDLVQVVREALSNASRHGRASVARVSLRLDGDRAVLEVTDDGGGFDVEAAARPGHGLENFRWRAERLGGEVEVTSAIGRGTTVRLALPV